MRLVGASLDLRPAWSPLPHEALLPYSELSATVWQDALQIGKLQLRSNCACSDRQCQMGTPMSGLAGTAPCLASQQLGGKHAPEREGNWQCCWARICFDFVFLLGIYVFVLGAGMAGNADFEAGAAFCEPGSALLGISKR